MAKGDEIVLGDGFQFDAPILVDGVPRHTLIKDDATIQVSNGTIWQNPFDRFDVDRSGDVGTRDALVTINRLARQIDSTLPLLPESVDEFFYDVNGDGTATPSDALAVVNRLAALAAGGESEQLSWRSSVDRVSSQSGVSSDWIVAKAMKKMIRTFESLRRRSSSLENGSNDSNHNLDHLAAAAPLCGMREQAGEWRFKRAVVRRSISLRGRDQPGDHQRLEDPVPEVFETRLESRWSTTSSPSNLLTLLSK